MYVRWGIEFVDGTGPGQVRIRVCRIGVGRRSRRRHAEDGWGVTEGPIGVAVVVQISGAVPGRDHHRDSPAAGAVEHLVEQPDEASLAGLGEGTAEAKDETVRPAPRG